MKIINVVGARPNFMKIAPLIEEMKKYEGIEAILVHTGQHYDGAMSELFFEELGIPRPDINLEVGSGSHAVQTATIMLRFEEVLLKERPHMVVIVGDVNSTLACALTSVKMGVPVSHVEAGLRSFDRTMPEEINRLLTDAISDYLFTTEKSAVDILLREGIERAKIHHVGNVMIDTLVRHKPKADRSNIISRMGAEPKSYGLVTLHRPSNVDRQEVLEGILSALKEISEEIPIIFPCHPRTWKKIEEFGLWHYFAGREGDKVESGVHLHNSLGYLDFLKLLAEARIVLTDSGGIQEETTFLGVPCMTLRENTERPATFIEGTNVIAGTDRTAIVNYARDILNAKLIKQSVPELWDGKASQRIVKILLNCFLKTNGQENRVNNNVPHEQE